MDGESRNLNNRAHASVFLDDDVEVRLKLSDYCREYHSEAFVDLDPGTLDEEIQELREKFDLSSYHSCKWNNMAGY